MFRSEASSGDALVATSGSVSSFIPDPLEAKEQGPTSVSPSPINIEVHAGNHVLFRLHFKFVITDEPKKLPGWAQNPGPDNTMHYEVRNLPYANTRMISSDTAMEVATTSRGDIFFVSWVAQDTGFGVLLHYTVFVKPGDGR